MKPRPITAVHVDIARFLLEVSELSAESAERWLRDLARCLALRDPSLHKYGAHLLDEVEGYRKAEIERKNERKGQVIPRNPRLSAESADSLPNTDQSKAKQSNTDQIKKIRREKKVASLPGDPLFLNPEFSLAWEEWEKSRKGKLTDHARALNLAELKRLVGDDVGAAIQIVNQSIRNTWKGFFPLKDANGKDAGTSQRGTFGTAGGSSSAAASRRAEKSSGEYAENLSL